MTLTGKFCPTFIDKNVKVCGDGRLPRVIHPGNSNLGFPKPRPIQNSKAHKSLNVDVWTCACRVSSLGRGNQERQDRCNQGRASFVWLHFKQRWQQGNWSPHFPSLKTKAQPKIGMAGNIWSQCVKWAQTSCQLCHRGVPQSSCYTWASQEASLRAVPSQTPHVDVALGLLAELQGLRTMDRRAPRVLREDYGPKNAPHRPPSSGGPSCMLWTSFLDCLLGGHTSQMTEYSADAKADLFPGDTKPRWQLFLD